MGFKEKVENNPIIWLLGVIVVGFSAGFGAYGTILKVTDQTTLPNAEYHRLENQAAKAQEHERELNELNNRLAVAERALAESRGRGNTNLATAISLPGSKGRAGGDVSVEPIIAVLSGPVMPIAVNACEYRANHSFRLRITGNTDELKFTGGDQDAVGNVTVTSHGEVYRDGQRTGIQSVKLTKAGVLYFTAYYSSRTGEKQKKNVTLFSAQSQQLQGCTKDVEFHLSFTIEIEQG